MADPRGPNKKRIRPSVSFTLPGDQVQFLEDVAEERGQTKSAMLQRIIAYYMKHGPLVNQRPNPRSAEEGAALLE